MFKRILSILMTMVIACSVFTICGGATYTSDCFSVDASVKKLSSQVTGSSTLLVKVKNTSNFDLKNVKIVAQSDDLQLLCAVNDTVQEYEEVKKNTVSTFVIDVSYSEDNKDLNFFQKCILFLKCLFIGKAKMAGTKETNKEYEVHDTTIRIGKKYCSMSFLITCEKSNLHNLTEEDVEEINTVNNAIKSTLCQTSFKEMNVIEKINEIDALLKNQAEQGRVIFSSITDEISTSSMYFDYACGVRGGVRFDNSDDTTQDETDSSEETTTYTEHFSTEKKAGKKQNGKVLILFAFNKSTDSRSLRMPFYTKLVKALGNSGFNTDLDEMVTIDDLANLSNKYKAIVFSGHGSQFEGSETFNLTYDITSEDLVKYSQDFLAKNLVIMTKENTSCVWVSSSFFKEHYQNNELKDTFIFSESCGTFGRDNDYEYGFSDAFTKAGASVIVGFHNKVEINYSRDFLRTWLEKLVGGTSASDAFEEVKTELGETDGRISNAGEPIIVGDKEKTETIYGKGA